MTTLAEAKAWRDDATSEIERIDEALAGTAGAFVISPERDKLKALRTAHARTQRVADALVHVLEEAKS